MYPDKSSSLPYSLPFARFPSISPAVILTVFQSINTSIVLVRVSARPKGIIGGIQPRAYSSAKQPSDIRYCFTEPLGRWCWLPGG